MTVFPVQEATKIMHVTTCAIDTSMSTDHEEDARDTGAENVAEDLHIPEITRSKARALQEVVRSITSIPYAEQGATKILQVTTFAWKPGMEEPASNKART